jgi:VCBS repeat-containing protein
LNFAGKPGSHADFGSSAHDHIDSLSNGADTVTVPDAHLLFSGDYARSGADLIVSDHLHRVVVPNYFNGDRHPTLVSPQGAPLDPKFIDALTGHVQYAQAAGTAAAPKVVGHVVKMTGSASIVRNGVTIDVNSGDVVYQNDVVQTGSGSALGLVMIDGTTFNLTANARLMMNDLTYDAASNSNTSLFTLVQGAATFVAGQVAKTGDMKVSTPVATMGIRGTAVILDVSSTDGTVSVSVANQRDGQVHAVQVFNARGDLIGTVTSNGSMLTLTPTASFEVIAQESNKTVAQVLTEFNAFQQLLSTYEIAKQLFPNTPFPTDGRRGDNTQQPLTKFAGSSSSPGDNSPGKNNGDGGAAKDGKGDGTVDPLTGKPTGDIADPKTKVVFAPGDDAPKQIVDVAATSIPFVVTPSPVSRISSGPGDHFGPVMSADGQFVTYDPDGAIYLFDRQTGATRTIASPGGGLTYGSPAISSDGHFVVYQGSDGAQSWIFIYNNDASDPAHYGQITRLMAGGQAAISGDGGKLVIERGGSIGLYDQSGHELANITAAAIGATGTLWKPAISADGHIIAFWSSDLSSPGGAGQLFTYDLSTATIKSIASTATDAGDSAASFSADGHYVVYQSDAPDGHSEIYLYDLRAGQVVFHTANPDPSYNPVLSPDGHFIIFASDARLTADDKNAVTDIYVIDVTDPSHPVYKLVSVLDDGTQGDDASNLGAAISAGGQLIAFGSRASNFSSHDAPGTGDIFVVDPTSGHSAIILESRNSPAVLTTGGVIQLTGEHSGITLGVSDSRIKASFDSHGDIQWSFSEPRSDFALLQPGQISVQNFVITLSTARSTTEIPVKVSIYDVDQPVVPVADAAPVASPVTLTTGTEDTSYTISAAALLAGVVDIDGPSLSITAVGILSGGGGIVDNHDGTFSYTPAPNYNGPVEFSYTASDGTLSASSTATLDIANVNDAPVVTTPVTGGGAEGSGIATVNLLNFASDVDAGAVLHVANLVRTDAGSGFPAGVTLSADGNSLLVDTNNPAYDHLAQGASFAAHFSYDVVDQHGALAHQTATVTIGGTNDAPVILQTAGLLGIGFTASTHQFFIAAMDPGSAAVTTLNNFAFDSGSWVASTLTASHSDLYVISGAGPTVNGSLYDFDATTGALKSVVAAGAQFEALRAESNGTLIGIGYDFSIGKNFVATMDPHSGAVTTLNNFTFDSLYWGSSSLIVSGNDLYALSAPTPGGHGSLYDFNATTGALKSVVSLSVEFQGLRAGPNGKLIGIGQNFIASVDPVTGAVTTLNHFAFDTGAWNDSSLTVVGNDVYALSSGPTGNGSLYDFDATTGALKSFVPAGAQFDDLVAGGHGSGAVSVAGMEGSGAFNVNLLQNAFDVDDGAVLHVANLVRTDGGGMPAGFALSPDGNSVSVDTNSPVYNSLAPGQTFTAHFGYDVVDEHGASVHQTATVTIAGANDAPVIDSRPVSEIAVVNSGDILASTGQLVGRSIGILSGDGHGGFTPVVVVGVSNSLKSPEASLGDVNGDGIPDLVVGDDGVLGIHMADGTGGFSPAVNIATGVSAFKLIDIDGDGSLDIITGDPGGRAGLLADDGHGGFSAIKPGANLLGPGFETADVNGDGLLDNVSGDNSTVRVQLGDGHGGFSSPATFANGIDASHLALGDVNGDGAVDIVTVAGTFDPITSQLGAKVSVLFGDGRGGFSTPGFLDPGGINPTAIALADLNHDGAADIITADPTRNQVSIISSNGHGGFLQPVALTDGLSGPNSIAVADVTGDGMLDIVVTDDHGNVDLIAGDGHGGFLPTVKFASGGNIPAAMDLVEVSGAGPLHYIENQSPRRIDPGLTISDADSQNLVSATVSIANNFHAAEDILGFTDQNGIHGSYNSATGVLTLSGVSSVANYQAALRSVTYFNGSDDPSSAARTVTYQVDDGSSQNHSSNIFTATVDVIPTDDAPVIAHPALTISQGHTVTLTTADIDFVDPDSPVVTYAVSNLSHGHFEIGSGNDAVETATFTSADVAAGFVSFVDDGSTGTPTFSLTPNDGSIDGATVNGVVTFSAANYTMTSTEGVTISVTPEGATSGFVFPGAGNVTTPGIPEDRIAIGYDVGNSHVVLDNAPLLGVHQMTPLSSETHSSGGATFVSTTLNAGHDVTLVQTIALGDDANFFTTTIDITNNGATDISNLRFLRNFDPDQDVQAHNDYNTLNDVVQKPDGAETFAIVSAKGVESHTTVAMIGLGAEWQGSVYGLFTNTDPYAAGAFDAPVDPDGTRADKSLSLTSSLGTLRAGDHIEVTYLTTNNVATAGSNALFGTAGADAINGLGGDDLLIGLKGADTFVFNAASGGSGHDTVADFAPGQDKISLDYHAFDANDPVDFSNWLGSHTTVSGGDVLIDLNFDGNHAGVDTILLKNVALASLQASDFHTL